MSDMLSDIQRLCHDTNVLAERANWQWTGHPVICWEFATIHDFALARADLLRAIEPHMLNQKNAERLMAGGEAVEIDCLGVTIRLVCKQSLMTPRGPYGAAEVKTQIFRGFKK